MRFCPHLTLFLCYVSRETINSFITKKQYYAKYIQHSVLSEKEQCKENGICAAYGAYYHQRGICSVQFENRSPSRRMGYQSRAASRAHKGRHQYLHIIIRELLKTLFFDFRHCGLDPQSTVNKEMLKQVQHDDGSF